MDTLRRIGLGALALTLFTGCIDVPSPLAPQFSGSVGFPHHGVLTGSIPLDKKGTGYVLFRPDDDNRYGTPRLVGTIAFAAAQVARARPHGQPLVVGDLSPRHGGQSDRHRSHRSGRDADLLYFVTTPEGVPVKSPGFVRFGADGLAEVGSKGKFVRLDIERQWLLVKTLLTTPGAEIQWLFVSRPVEGLIIEHARATDEDPELVWVAETVLQQPSDSAVHDDHMHLRLSCTPDDAIAGCDGGPRWPFLADLPVLDMSADEEVAAIMESL